MILGYEKIDLHMHTTISDGTDTPEEILEKVCAEKIDLFSVTDHDAIAVGISMPEILTKGDPAFIRGVEFSCRNDGGKYHILGYGYDPDVPGIREVVDKGHSFRMGKTRARVDFLKEAFGFEFPKEDLKELFARANPGKPHIAAMMVRLGYAETIEIAMRDFIDRKKFTNVYISPEEAIEGILRSHGIPVLAHPVYGSGNELIMGEELEERIRYLMDLGLAGLECYYSGYSHKMQEQVLSLAEKYDLYVTAGSDYHGGNKLVPLADHGLTDTSQAPEGMKRFLQDVIIF